MTTAAHLLLVDDEAALVRALAPLLRSRGYQVTVATTGRDALARLDTTPVDCVILDLGLPDMPGSDVCRRIRETSAVPILVLSARGAEADKVEALDLGADDYVTKPFGPEELLARIRVGLRRGSADVPATGVQTVGDLRIDQDRHRVFRDDEEIRLTPKELSLLVFLARTPGRVITHRQILRALWGPHAVTQPEHLWVLVSQLRRKIERNPSRPEYIVTEPWVGYRFGRDAGP